MTLDIFNKLYSRSTGPIYEDVIVRGKKIGKGTDKFTNGDIRTKEVDGVRYILMYLAGEYSLYKCDNNTVITLKEMSNINYILFVQSSSKEETSALYHHIDKLIKHIDDEPWLIGFMNKEIEYVFQSHLITGDMLLDLRLSIADKKDDNIRTQNDSHLCKICSFFKDFNIDIFVSVWDKQAHIKYSTMKTEEELECVDTGLVIHHQLNN